MNVYPTMGASFLATVDWLYAGLMRTAGANPACDSAQGLEGRLVYAGELHSAGCALVAAANIAGAASLTASADPVAQRQALRDGVIDFLVTTLDEALRILKNEVRKQQPVAVCVAMPPESVEAEMLERGVLPDLLPPGSLDAIRFEAFLAQGARQVDPASAETSEIVLTWSVGGMQTLWLSRLDAILDDCLGEEDVAARRWLHHAPRYLGRLAGGVRLLRSRAAVGREFLRRVEEQVARGEIDAPVDVSIGSRGRTEKQRFSPVARPPSAKPFKAAEPVSLLFCPKVH